MLARIGRLAFGVVVLFAVGLLVVVVASAASASAEKLDPRDRRPVAALGSGSRPSLSPEPEDDELDLRASDPDVSPADRSGRTFAVLLAVCVLLSMIGGAVAGVVLGSGLR